VAYTTSVAATGGAGTLTYSVSAGALPAGLALGATGAITGTPTAVGTASFTIKVADAFGDSATQAYSITVSYPALSISTASLPGGVLGTAYAQTLTATGGSGGYTWSTNGAGTSSLAAVNLTLSSGGVVAGTPASNGTATFAATVTDSASHTATVTFTIVVSNALTITTATSLPIAYTNAAYSQSLAAAGGSGTGYTWSVTGTSNLSTFNLSLSSAGVLSGTPTTAGTASFTAQVKDSNSNTATQAFTIQVYAPLSLPTSNPATLPSATVGQSYTGSVNSAGGTGTGYVWTVTGLPANGLSYTTNNGILNITGTPSTTGTVSFTASVKDSTGTTVGPVSYSIVVNSAGSTVSGQVVLMNNCNSSSVPPVTVSINTTPAQHTTTDSAGNYSFTNIANGSYVITPSISGPSAVFYPATRSETINNTSPTGQSFQVVLGYTVSGNVSYAGTKTGQTYLTLNSNCNSGSQPGTSISDATLTSGGAFTIRGVPPGSYTLSAWMDHLGQGAQNITDPSGVSGASVVVGSSNVTGAVDTLIDPTVTTPSSGPTINSITPNSQGVLISFKAITNSSGVEAVGGYTVQWSTSSSFATESAYSFAAIGTNSNVWFLNNGLASIPSSFVSGTQYYFRARGELSGGTVHTPWTVYGGSTPTAVTIGTPSGASYNTVTGTVTIPSTVTPTGPLYVGYYNQSTGAVYANYIASPSSSSANAFTVSVPNGTYYFFGILDQNNDGLIDAGDLTNTHTSGNSGNITISGNMTGQSLTLPSANSTGTAATTYWQSTSSGGSSTGYDVDLNVREGNKLPVAATLTAASNPNVITPVDVAFCNNCGTPQFQYYASIGGDVPSVGDTYTFNVTYSDGTTGTVTGTVTGWNGTGALVGATDLATNPAPTGTSSTSTTPTFTWTYPPSPSSYTYQFYISDNNGNTLWQIPGNNSNLNGFPSTVTEIVWGTDPTGDSSNTPTVSNLTSGTTYTWQIQVQDSTGNQAQTQVSYTP
jgi:hypothetical protein